MLGFMCTYSLKLFYSLVLIISIISLLAADVEETDAFSLAATFFQPLKQELVNL